MRQRRKRGKNMSFLPIDLKVDLKLVTTILNVLVIIFLIVFIISACKVKIRSTSMISKEPKMEESTNIASKDYLEKKDIDIDKNKDKDKSEENKKDSTLEKSVDENDKENSTKKDDEKKDTTIKMAFTGDIMCHNTIYNDAYQAENEVFDFSYIFENIKYYLQTPDITVGNLETTFAGPRKKI